uniref:Uncharacterized protein n=1 Tax=Rhizophora mucronata TaxID=61149 RepID=A0A2P2IZE3_RHIMU
MYKLGHYCFLRDENTFNENIGLHNFRYKVCIFWWYCSCIC